MPRTEAPPEWQAKVEQLSMRGITAQALLNFYKSLGGRLMPHYQAGQHTTSDVVRQAIIPHTREGRCAYATFINGPRQPDRMVTHSWRNLFRDLVAAVIADAAGESSFGLVAALLEEDVSVLEALMRERGTSDRVYWICAFAVNQHAGICENRDGDRDSVTGQVHPGCTCGLPKMLNTTAPLSTEGPSKGQSIGCEMNKFDDMMALLSRKNPHFSQVVAVDAGFVLFRRAWCVAELVKADEARLRQHVKMHSRKAVEDMASSLRNLRVESMEASRAEERIEDTCLFNQKLQSLIFDKAGLLSCWRQLDAAHRMEEVGSLLKWSFADNGRGIVWQFWHLRD
ncbi:mycA [Symbiodinium necroappetens]|uniref:MycA protein n=1 Tax=Symbiodinium necroappetens TaxID=1628268 RepID=A0A812NN00_9DINO|nr:mycA [Symbiodinium necroappetens]